MPKKEITTESLAFSFSGSYWNADKLSGERISFFVLKAKTASSFISFLPFFWMPSRSCFQQIIGFWQDGKGKEDRNYCARILLTFDKKSIGRQ